MPLSEREKKVIDQLEHDLGMADGPAPHGPIARSGARRTAITALAGIALGLTLVIVGLMLDVIVVAVIGFVAIVAAAMLLSTTATSARATWVSLTAARRPHGGGSGADA